MWGFQPHFRLDVEMAARTALRAIGAGLGPRAFLVGFGVDDSAPFPICIEPETDPIAAADLTGVADRARSLYEAHEDFDMFYSDRGVHASRHAQLRDQARAAALCEALEASAAGQGCRFFAGPSARVDKYDVHAVISVVASSWAVLPTLATGRRQRIDLAPSLQEAVVRAILVTAARALDHQQPPQSLSAESMSDHDLVKSAARRFVQSVGILSGQLFASGLCDALDAVAAQPYEGRTGVGTTVLGAESSNHVEIDIHLITPVSIATTRAFRKVLEMSGPDLHVLCDGVSVYGLGRVADTYQPAAEEVFMITVVGRGSWELAHSGVLLLRMDNTRPSLPRARLSEAHFADTVNRLFPEAQAADISALWALANGAVEQEHGTMLVVHRDAAGEAARLVPQALIIEPTVLSDSALRAVTNIDGAVLVSPDARCCAVGVILDGRATGIGDSSRGARYNSAVRYRQAVGDDCLVIIVSEDGMINLLPDLKRRVNRSDVERAVADHDAASHGEVDFEEFSRHDDHVMALAFYLNAAQCDQVNAVRARVEAYRWNLYQMSIGYAQLAPDPRMNDSYFL
jgi:hypothetical protein